MNKKNTASDTKTSDSSKEIMLVHYQLIHQRYLYERDVGERRLNVFLTIATAIIGGLVLLSTQNQPGSDLPILWIAALSFLFVLGLGTFDRGRIRMVECVSWLAKANLAQQYFTEQDRKLSKYLLPYNLKEISGEWVQSFALSGLGRTMAILNTFIAMALSIVVGNYWLTLSIKQIIWFAISVIVIVWLLHVLSWRRGMKKYSEGSSLNQAVG